MAGKTIGELTTLENPSSSAVIPISADGSTLQKTTFGDVANKYITNCLTEIPQDIQLELNNGTLTLKAGSKVYIPNGFETDGTTPHFDMVEIPANVSTTSTNDDTWIVCYNAHTGGIPTRGIEVQTDSGTSTPTSGYCLYYNTAENKIYNVTDGSSSAADEISIPVCVCTATTTGITKINQILNGFSFLGRTLFVLPGVKYLIPNGTKSNGEPKSIAMSIDKVITNTELYVSGITTINAFFLTETGNIHITRYRGGYDSEPDIAGIWGTYYNRQQNITYYNDVTSWGARTILIGGYTRNNVSGKLVSITPFTPIRNQETVPHLIESYTDGDGNWYKIYSNGWCEQGGYNSNAGHTAAYTATVTLLKPMKNTLYHIMRTPNKNGIDNAPGTKWISGVNANTRSTTQFQFFTDQVGYVAGDFWEVKGYCW